MSRRLRRMATDARTAARFSNALVLALAAITAFGLYAYHGRVLPPQQALVLMFSGPVAAVAILRPGWVVLALLAAPPGLFGRLPAAIVTLVPLVALGVLAVREWAIDLSWRSGAYPVLGLFVWASVHRTSESTPGFSDGFLTLLLYYALLVLLTYNLVRGGHLPARAVVTALVVGAVVSCVLELALSSSPGQGGASGLLVYGRSIGNIAVMGLVAVLVRWGFDRRADPPGGAWTYAAAAAVLSTVIGLTLLRAAWVATLLALGVVALWARRGRWLLLVPLVIALVLAFPTARERVFPGAVEEGLDLTEYTTGRWRLWVEAAREIEPSPVLGRGYGYWWSLSPEEVFGSRVAFVTSEEQEFVFLHNDALYFQVELGVVGHALFWLLWLHVLVVYTGLLRAPPRWAIVGVASIGVPLMFLTTEMVGNGLALRGVSERFFVVIGAVSAVYAMARDQSTVAAPSVSSAGSSSDRAALTNSLDAATSAGGPAATSRPPSRTIS